MVKNQAPEEQSVESRDGVGYTKCEWRRWDPHRFNVATSRAKCITIVVASPELFVPDCRTPEQMKLANAFCRYAELSAEQRSRPAQPIDTTT